MGFGPCEPLEGIWGKLNLDDENGRNHTGTNGLKSTAWQGAQANHGQADAVAHRPPGSRCAFD